MDATLKPGEGMAAVLRAGMFYNLFTGLIRTDEERPWLFTGGLIDYFGESTLSKITMSSDVFYFTKKYDRRQDLIEYRFKLRGNNLWVGGYSGPVTGAGLAKCYLTEVPETFLSPADDFEPFGEPSVPF
ncbi:MAG: hypothetical protein NTV72_01955 [Candidatus Taylorbacteria bacterium]|nr:hypothetical protein [Candidatus Taylorbacteria bacterium]